MSPTQSDPLNGESDRTGGSHIVFSDRSDAGKQLAQRLVDLRGLDVVVLGLPRGGVPVAFEVAKQLEAPLDVIVVRKLGVPFQPEVAMGAIAEGGFEVLDQDLIARAGVSSDQVDRVRKHEREVLEKRLARFRRGRELVDLSGRVAVIVDDGLATGATARVACDAARHLGAEQVILAVPVAAPRSLAHIEADRIVFVSAPTDFMAVGFHYDDFFPTTDEEVISLLDAASKNYAQLKRSTVTTSTTSTSGIDEDDCDIDCEIPSDGVVLQGHLHLPANPRGVVVFAHGSGSSRHSARNRYVASVLYDVGLGTLLLDLLTTGEERDPSKVFNIELLARRLSGAVRWLKKRPDAQGARIGLFGASTGAGAALWAATDCELEIAAIVSRGGRPDLALDRLHLVVAPTLLIVGGEDHQVLEFNHRAASMLHCFHQVVVVPGATHLFEEPGTLAEAALLARDWFVRYLSPPVGDLFGKQTS